MYEIYALLAKVGITSKYKGYDYIAAAVKYLLDRPNKRISVTKELYPELGKMFHVPPTRVEQNIRFTINTVWEKRKGQLEKYRGTEYETRPTNAEFLTVLAGILQSQKD